MTCLKYILLSSAGLLLACNNADVPPESGESTPPPIESEDRLPDRDNKNMTVIDPDEVIAPGDKNWQSVVFLEMADNSICTGTLVGKDTLLTAAHCVDAQNPSTPAQLKEIMFQLGGKFHVYECTMTPQYSNTPLDSVKFRGYFDVALCKALLPNRLPTDMVYENVDVVSARTPNTEITIAGYGCTYETDPATGQQRLILDSQLRIGTAEIGPEIITDPDRFARDGHFRTKTRRNDQSADACQGDSGGPVFNERRGVIAVVSGAGAIPSTQEHLSRYSDLSHNNNSGFMQNWLNNNPGQQICGVNPQVGDINHQRAKCR